ncbi:unnamed protein product [Cyclocybe aegerita]|uniref:Gag-like protein n=1 Tax=Cyclocybe aegerita TaxID=1973307 RepID=A0A8S0X179_CYCAE|nr:unnamed protein product [Cyclocybe aegerita]
MSDLPLRGRGARPPEAVPRSRRGGDSGSAPPAIPPLVAGSSSFGGDASPISPDPTSTRATYSTVVPARSRHTSPRCRSRSTTGSTHSSAYESDSGTAHPQEMEVEGTQGGEEVSRDPSVDLLLGQYALKFRDTVEDLPGDLEALDDLGRPASPSRIPASKKRKGVDRPVPPPPQKKSKVAYSRPGLPPPINRATKPKPRPTTWAGIAKQAAPMPPPPPGLGPQRRGPSPPPAFPTGPMKTSPHRLPTGTPFEVALPSSTSFIKILNVPYFDLKGSKITQEALEKALRALVHAEVFAYLSTQPRIDRNSAHSTLCTVYCNVWDSQQGTHAKKALGQPIFLAGRSCAIRPTARHTGVPVCQRCWKWGHPTIACKAKQLSCPICSGPHEQKEQCQHAGCCKGNAKAKPTMAAVSTATKTTPPTQFWAHCYDREWIMAEYRQVHEHAACRQLTNPRT